MLGRAIWSVLRSNVGASYLVSTMQQCCLVVVVQQCWCELVGQCRAAMLARAIWSVLGASYAQQCWGELFGQCCAFFVWSVLCSNVGASKFLVSAAQQCWRALFWSALCSNVGASYLSVLRNNVGRLRVLSDIWETGTRLCKASLRNLVLFVFSRKP